MILRNLLYFIAILLIIGWALGVFFFKHEGKLIHILAILAVISLVMAVTRKAEADPIN